MIAGPNGSGKTTTANLVIPNYPSIYEFINADEIAKGLAPRHPESVSLTASKLMINRMKELLEAHQNIAFETTGSGTNYVKHLKKAQMEGYKVYLMFLWLSSPELAVQRVRQRVSQGGHHIPEETIIRRYYLGLKNLFAYYLPLVDNAVILDNSVGVHKIIAKKNKMSGLKIEKPNLWEEMERVAYDK